MIDEKIIELSKFKKNKREVYVDFINGLVKWKNNEYNITYVNVGGKNYPYVVLKKIRPWSEIKPLVQQINKKKDDLKFVEYEMKNHDYFVIGIGKDAIKVIKDYDKEHPEYLRYDTTDGQDLLMILINNLSQMAFL